MRDFAVIRRWSAVLAWVRQGMPDVLTIPAFELQSPLWLLALAGDTAVYTRVGVPAALMFATCGVLALGVAEAGLVGLLPPEHMIRSSVFVVVVGCAIGGVIAQATVYALVYLASGSAPEASATRVLAIAVFGVAWAVMFGRLMHLHREERRRRIALLRNLAFTRALAVQAGDAIDGYRTRVLADTEAVVTEQLQKARDHSASPDLAVDQLQALVDDVVRPLSHELRGNAQDERQLIEAIEEMQTPAPRPLADYWRAARGRGSGAMLAATPVLASGLAVFASQQEAQVVPTLCLFVAYTFAVAAVSWVIIAIEALSSEYAETLTSSITDADWAAARLRQLAWSERERIGRALHGDVQSRIVATALQMQLGHPAQVAQSLATLETEVQSHFAGGIGEEAWRRGLQRIEEVWKFSIQLTIDTQSSVDQALDSDPVAAHAVVEVIREAVTNAVRHARATTIKVNATLASDVVLLEIQDDGNHMKAVGSPGLGSKMMDEACLEWKLERLDQGHRFMAKIPAGERDV